MASLPLDVIGSIFVFVDEPGQICLMRLVCRKWADLITNNLWGRLCLRRWRKNPTEAELNKYWLVPLINNGAGSVIDWRSVYWIKHLWDRAMIALAKLKELTPDLGNSDIIIIDIMESGWLKRAVHFRPGGIKIPYIKIGIGMFPDPADRMNPTAEGNLLSVLSFWIELTSVLMHNATTLDHMNQIFDGIMLGYSIWMHQMNLPIRRLVNLAKTVVQIAHEKKDQINLFVEWAPRNIYVPHANFQQFNPYIGILIGVLELHAVGFGPISNTTAVDLIRACMDLYYAWLPSVDKQIWFSYVPFQSYTELLRTIIKLCKSSNMEFFQPILDEYLQPSNDIRQQMAAIQTIASSTAFACGPRDKEGMKQLVQFKSDIFHRYIQKYYVLVDDVNAVNLLLTNMSGTYKWLMSHPSTVYSQYFADLLSDIFARPYFNELAAVGDAMQLASMLTDFNERFIPNLVQICKNNEQWRRQAVSYLIEIIRQLREYTTYKELIIDVFDIALAKESFESVFVFRNWWYIVRSLITKEEIKQISDRLDDSHPFKQELDY